MTFVSLEFLVFIAVFAALYLVTRGTARLVAILLSSCVFYGWWDWRFLFLIWFSILLDYSASRILEHTSNESRRRVILGVSVACNLGVLGFFKYCNFFLGSFWGISHWLGYTSMPIEPLNIILPVGISFYTFQSMSYTIDVYRRVMPAEHSLIRFASYVTFFPQLVAGPIVRAELFLPQLRHDQRVTGESLVSGLQLVVWGYFMKVVVADSLSAFSDLHFAAPQFASSLAMLIAVIFYAFQISGDFFGYSLIAIGIGRIFGFDLGINFDRPYFSPSFSEFWQRWHISLSSWLRDYLYIPLGGNRYGSLMTYRNLFLTMLLGGLWHGASWNFVIWGCLHGLYLVVQRLVGSRLYKLAQGAGIPNWITWGVSVPVVFTLTCVAWVFFRAATFDQAMLVLSKIVVFDGQGFAAIPLKMDVAKGFALIALVVLCEAFSFRVAVREYFSQRPVAMALAGAVLIWMMALIGTFSGSAFIYFQF